MPDNDKAYPVRDDSLLTENSSIARILELIAPHERVLDVGCSSGDLARFLSERGSEVVGIDRNAEALAAAAKFCSRTIAADLDEVRLPDLLADEMFDAIVFADVLEHLRDPWSVLDSARTLLRPGGAVVISVPNIAHGAIRLGLLAGSFAYREFGILDDTHLRFFTRRSLDALLVRAGYTLERLERTTLPLFEPSDLVATIDPERFGSEVIAAIRADAEHETLQFIVRAKPLNDDEKAARIADAYALASAYEAEVEDTRAALVGARRMLAQAEQALHAAHLERSPSVIAANEDREARLRAALSQATDQLATLASEVLDLGRRLDVAVAGEEAATLRALAAERLLHATLASVADDYGNVVQITRQPAVLRYHRQRIENLTARIEMLDHTTESQRAEVSNFDEGQHAAERPRGWFARFARSARNETSSP